MGKPTGFMDYNREDAEHFQSKKEYKTIMNFTHL